MFDCAAVGLSPLQKKARLPLANEILEHLRHRWVQIDLTLAAFGLQVIVNLTPPRLLTDFDCGAVRGNIGYIDPQGLTKSQPCECAGRVEYTVIFLFWCTWLAVTTLLARIGCFGFLSSGGSMKS